MRIWKRLKKKPLTKFIQLKRTHKKKRKTRRLKRIRSRLLRPNWTTTQMPSSRRISLNDPELKVPSAAGETTPVTEEIFRGTQRR